MKRYSKGLLKNSMVTMLGVAGLTLTNLAPAQADNYYVSKNGDNSDGKSWKTAWNELDQVVWEKLKSSSNDKLIIDGGENQMVYHKPLRVGGSGGIPIVTMGGTGHNGQVVIDGLGQQGPGIDVPNVGVFINGGRRGGLVVKGWELDGVRLSEKSGNFEGASILINLELTNNGRSGIHLESDSEVIADKCIIHDNATNVLIEPSSAFHFNPSLITRCWIYSTNYFRFNEGVRMATSNPDCKIEKCVIGPGLRRGFVFAEVSDWHRTKISNCLLINATRSNVASGRGLNISNVTSFMTKADPNGITHDCLTVKNVQNPSETNNVESSIFYGGVVRVPVGPGAGTTRFNTQYRTTGNTAYLGSTMQDPLFVTDVSKFSDRVSLDQLIQADFALRKDSPVPAGSGSSMSSVAQLLAEIDGRGW
ncbi:MAG: right-handed parallel beta-helix repeat-containing protein [Candidatus Obscuribacterales bacterium]|nr:right-handed parallel beta-helix repeat-containing protein [Candidatus Obscuribacterales bacterium]